MMLPHFQPQPEKVVDDAPSSRQWKRKRQDKRKHGRLGGGGGNEADEKGEGDQEDPLQKPEIAPVILSAMTINRMLKAIFKASCSLLCGNQLLFGEQNSPVANGNTSREVEPSYDWDVWGGRTRHREVEIRQVID
ncbi:hypothetical protein FN846DRAFT_891172 [Sphaerosporella brunnea]|uniref:Uncharacterized protein n=1 Tax=Sphaerosporella brunnea TaxID=1250544 RepID=A0A5J5EU40_9PEZI|nr:hypothetical protein FN846DRAFT_891172 [Sphaerosporella brunnea]